MPVRRSNTGGESDVHSDSCIRFAALKICDGDIIIVELTTRSVVKGVVVDVGGSRRFGFVSLAPGCGEEPTEAVSIRRIARVLRVGRCGGADAEG